MSKKYKKCYSEFWHNFLTSKKSHPILFRFNPTPKQMENDYIWSPIKTGSKIHFTFVVYPKSHLVELTIQESKEESSRIYNMLYLQKTEIETAFGENIVWDGPAEGRNRCIVKSFEYDGGYLTKEKYNFIFDNFLVKMSTLIKSLMPYLK